MSAPRLPVAAPRFDHESPPSEGISGPSKRLRSKGSGGIFFIRDGVWRVDIEVGRDKVSGRRRRISRQVPGSRKDAEAALARLKVAAQQRRAPSGRTTARSVRAALDLYLEAADAGTIELAPSTILTSRSAANTMCSTALLDGRTFGTIQLHRLTWKEIEEMFGAMRTNGSTSDWVRRCATVLSRSLDFARKRGLIDSNPSKDAERPRSTKTKPTSPKTEEVRRALALVGERDPELADAVLVLASTGMRRGELLALQWGDVDHDRREVHVAAAVTDGGPGKGVMRKSTKRNDWRDVPLTVQAGEAMRRQLTRTFDRFGREPLRTDFVFSKPGEPAVPYRPDTFTDRWSKAAGSSEVTLLQLRHYVATTMLDAGETYRTVADLLGNSENTLRLHYDGRTNVGKRRAVDWLEL
jgi:integrase